MGSLLTNLFLISILVFVPAPSSGTLESTSNPTFSSSTSNLAFSSSSAKLDQSEVIDYGSKSFLQAFYWLTPRNTAWWRMLEDKVPELAADGFDAIWGPPMVKTEEGDIASAGYEPYDFYDLGEFDQQGGIPTRYGTRAELESFITTANANGLGVIADVVINHNQGGELEFNPFTQTYTPTNFMNVASGLFPRNYTAYHPCEFEEADNYQFADFPDLCHANPYVREELIKWGKWLKDEIGFDGWRFDVALGINATMLRDWMNEVGGSPLSIAEYWGGNYQDMVNYLDATDNTLGAFDFFLMYALRWMVLNEGSYDLRNLQYEGLLGKGRKNQAMTFVVNHDTVREPNVNIPQERLLPYSFILTHEGYPSVFWQDYFDENLRPHLISLLRTRADYARGGTDVLYADSDLYVMQRNGDPGLIYALNDSPYSSKTATVSTKWQSTTLYEITNKIPQVAVLADSSLTITVPPRSYVVLTQNEIYDEINSLTDRESFVESTQISQSSPTIDGQFGFDWGYPITIDRMGDAFSTQIDLENGYAVNDGEFLYIAFTYAQNLFDSGNLQYAIALDTVSGGSFEDPLHENIKFQSSGSADYVFYLYEDPNNPWNEISTGNYFQYNQELSIWEDSISISANDFSSDALLGFTEIRIPLEKLNLKDGDQFKIKVYSTSDVESVALDSMPQDAQLVASDGNSWLAFSNPLAIAIPETTATTNEPTAKASDEADSPYPSPFVFLVMFPIVLRIMRYKRH